MSEGISWRQAEDAMLAGEECEMRLAGSAMDWRKARMSDGCMMVFSEPYGGGPQHWWEPPWAYSALQSAQWRRAPKTPRVHELPARWRIKRTAANDEYARGQEQCAAELDAATREDELVSLKGVTAGELAEAYMACDTNLVVSGMEAVLAHLRGKAKP